MVSRGGCFCSHAPNFSSASNILSATEVILEITNQVKPLLNIKFKFSIT